MEQIYINGVNIYTWKKYIHKKTYYRIEGTNSKRYIYDKRYTWQSLYTVEGIYDRI